VRNSSKVRLFGRPNPFCVPLIIQMLRTGPHSLPICCRLWAAFVLFTKNLKDSIKLPWDARAIPVLFWSYANRQIKSYPVTDKSRSRSSGSDCEFQSSGFRVQFLDSGSPLPASQLPCAPKGQHLCLLCNLFMQNCQSNFIMGQRRNQLLSRVL